MSIWRWYRVLCTVWGVVGGVHLVQDSARRGVEILGLRARGHSGESEIDLWRRDQDAHINFKFRIVRFKCGAQIRSL